MKEFKSNSSYGWHIGEVVKGDQRKNNKAQIVKGCKIIDVWVKKSQDTKMKLNLKILENFAETLLWL